LSVSAAPDLEDLRLFDVQEVVARLRISRGKLYLLLQDGSLPSLHIGARRLVRATDLRKFIEQGTA
jgi:excisionase family DNA binding protein